MEFQITNYDIGRQRSRERKDPLERLNLLIKNGDSRYNPNNCPWFKVIKNEPCSYCNGPGKTIDHIIPKSKGGTDNNDNLAPACLQCNAKKASLPLLYFLVTTVKFRAEIGSLSRRLRREYFLIDKKLTKAKRKAYYI